MLSFLRQPYLKLTNQNFYIAIIPIESISWILARLG